MSSRRPQPDNDEENDDGLRVATQEVSGDFGPLSVTYWVYRIGIGSSTLKISVLGPPHW
jgi:hypothetical protein